MTPFVTLLLSSIFLLPYGSALQVTPGSTCAAFCLDNPESDPLNPDSSNTKPGDITCTDDSYDNSPTGIKFKNCLDCLQKSNATSDSESDVTWFLYNIRYSLDVCLFGFPEPVKGVSSPCTTSWACQPLTTALEAGSLNAGRDQLEYCTADGNFTTSHHIDDCIRCFASSPNQAHMSNFMTALKAGCEQMPAPGDLIGLSDSLFSGSPVNITSLPTQTPTGNKDSGFGITSTGAIVGIAIGGALLLFGGIALFWIYHRRQKRAYGGLPSQHSDSRAGNRSITPFGGSGGGFSEKRAQSQTSDYELRIHRNYTNNAEYYSMLEKEIQSSRAQYAVDPNNARAGLHGVLPTHPAYRPQTHSLQASRESSPQPPRPVKSNKPDSYALQAYLNAAEDSGAPDLLPPPPPGPPPAAVLSDPSRFRGPSPNRYALHSRDSSVDNRGPSPDRRPLLNQSTAAAPNPPPPPPPPPPSTRASKVPSLAFPSVPRLRMPKKYTPPRIAVQEATPITGPSEPISYPGTEQQQQQQADISIGLDISNPVMPTEPRATENHWNRRKQPPPPLAIGQEANNRRPAQWTVTEAGAKTGNSTLYG
ncbi:hypothetical protein F5B17DRAFT_426634 [Nemania serpens]|nr:hypothetical protein F5B17DRAFT_426634 [Nemania serpens]